MPWAISSDGSRFLGFDCWVGAVLCCGDSSDGAATRYLGTMGLIVVDMWNEVAATETMMALMPRQPVVGMNVRRGRMTGG